MKKIFMLLAVAGMFGMTSCGGDVCDCLNKAIEADDEAAGKACFDEGTSEEDMMAKATECAEAAAKEGEGEGEGDAH